MIVRGLQATIGGKMSDHQHALLRRTFERAASREAEIVAATDNEPAGESLAEEIKKLVPAYGRFLQSIPVRKDWNDDL